MLCVCCALARPAAAQDYSWFEEDGSSSGSGSGSSGYQQQSRGPSSRQTSGGWGLGLRLGYALPAGSAFDQGALSNLVKGVLKPQLDITYGLNAHVVLGLYLAVGGGFQPNDRLKRACDVDGVDCRILLIESGLMAEYRILPSSLTNPWVGGNLGLTNLSTEVKSDAANFKTSFLGVGFGASLGLDFQFGAFGFGPFFSFQIGRFMRGKADFGGILGDDGETSGSDSIDKDRRGYHYWLNFGLRARYQFGA
ncbi:MAG TPA: hypothetical protein VFZ61_19110 [Polyangiales bacterium]